MQSRRLYVQPLRNVLFETSAAARTVGIDGCNTNVGTQSSNAAAAVLARYTDLVPGAPLLSSDALPLPLGSWVIAEMIANAIEPHVWRGPGSAKACGPDWTSIGPHIDSLASSQKGAPVRCFDVSGEQVLAIQRPERGAHLFYGSP